MIDCDGISDLAKVEIEDEQEYEDGYDDIQQPIPSRRRPRTRTSKPNKKSPAKIAGRWFYSGCQKNVPIAGRFFATTLMPPSFYRNMMMTSGISEQLR